MYDLNDYRRNLAASPLTERDMQYYNNYMQKPVYANIARQQLEKGAVSDKDLQIYNRNFGNSLFDFLMRR